MNYMKRTIGLLLMLLSVGSLPIRAQEVGRKIRYYFQQMPEVVMPMLSQQDRVSLADSYDEAKMPVSIRGKLIYEITLEKQTDNYIRMRTSQSGYTEWILLPLVNGTPVIMMIQTVERPIPDARLTFYTPDWQEISTSDMIITAPRKNDFLPPEIDERTPEGKSFANRLEPLYLTYELNPELLQMGVKPSLKPADDAAGNHNETLAKEIRPLNYYWSNGLWRRTDVKQ